MDLVRPHPFGRQRQGREQGGEWRRSRTVELRPGFKLIQMPDERVRALPLQRRGRRSRDNPPALDGGDVQKSRDLLLGLPLDVEVDRGELMPAIENDLIDCVVYGAVGQCPGWCL
ncbi:hypothetical protein D3C72_869710 [compost metagenome]